MKALKALVITMGLLIVVGIALVGYALSRGKQGTAPIVPENPATGVRGAYFTSELPVPKGARLDQVSAAGDRLVLRFSSPEGEKLVLLDSHTGQLAGTISLVPETP